MPEPRADEHASLHGPALRALLAVDPDGGEEEAGDERGQEDGHA